MIKNVKTKSLQLSAAVMTGAMMSGSAQAANTFSTVSGNLTTAVGNLPGLVSTISYLFGLILGALGVLKIKDHVENPGNTPLKEGAIRLAAAGSLLALPFIYNVMTGSVQGTAAGDTAAITLHATGNGLTGGS